MQSRWFTPQTAREALATLRGPAEAISRAWQILEATRPDLIRGDTPVDGGYFVLVRALRSAVASVERAGVIVRDGRSGCLEFPARRAGRPVILCWRVGEPGLASWREGEGDAVAHPLDDGPWDHPPRTAGP